MSRRHSSFAYTYPFAKKNFTTYLTRYLRAVRSSCLVSLMWWTSRPGVTTRMSARWCTRPVLPTLKYGTTYIRQHGSQGIYVYSGHSPFNRCFCLLKNRKEYFGYSRKVQKTGKNFSRIWCYLKRSVCSWARDCCPVNSLTRRPVPSQNTLNT